MKPKLTLFTAVLLAPLGALHAADPAPRIVFLLSRSAFTA